MPRLAEAIAAMGLLAGLAGCSPGDAVDSALFLRDLGRPTDNEDISRQTIAWRAGGTAYEADLYVGADADSRAGVVLVPGLAPEGRRDKRLIGLATALARRNFTVLVPDLPGFRAQRVSAGDSAPIAASVRQLRGRLGDDRAVGVAAISYAVGPAVLAALAPEPATRVDFMVSIGGYYDARAVTTFFTTGYFRGPSDIGWQRAIPNDFGKWVFVAANAERIADAADRTSLTAIARRKLANPQAAVDDLVDELGPEARAVMALLNNGDPERVPALVQALPVPIRADLDNLDLKRQDLSTITARFILIHGRDDAIIPYTESQALAAALRPDQVHLALLDNLAHADLGMGGMADAVRLWISAYAVMQQRWTVPDRAEPADAP